MKVSIIIAVKEWNDFLKESIQRCLHLSYSDYEIIILPDMVFSFNDPKVRVIATGSCLPIVKRNKGVENSSGEILAFIDEDSYPAETWLTCAIKNFDDPSVAAVGGPGITPPTERGSKQASGLVYESFSVSGNLRFRYRKGIRQYVDDWPPCNFLVRKSVFDEAGGFKIKFWPGEDMSLCQEITKNLKKMIVYDPEAVVFHHRKALFEGHFEQVAQDALHRGYFVKRFPQTSMRWQYFVPTIFLLWLFIGLLFFGVRGVFYLYIFSLLVYISVIGLDAYQKEDPKMMGLVGAGIFLTHVYYGAHFLYGLVLPKLNEEYEIVGTKNTH